MISQLDGPSKQFAINLTTITPVEVKEGSVLTDRKVITIMPLNDKIWVFFGDGLAEPTVNDVKTKGFLHHKNSIRSYEAGEQQDVWIISDSLTNDVRISERA